MFAASSDWFIERTSIVVIGKVITLVLLLRHSRENCSNVFNPRFAVMVIFILFILSFKAVDKTSTEVQVEVKRGQGTDTDITVNFKTRDLTERVTTKPGVDTYQAIAGEDYKVPTTVAVRFAKGEVSI